MKIIQNVVVKQVLTEISKQTLLDKFSKNSLQLQKECDQLSFELKKQGKNNKYQQTALTSNFQKEIDVRQEKIKLLDFQIEQLHKITVGSELKETEVQAIVEVNIGDTWDEVMNTKTIVIKEGIVNDIR